MRPLVLLAVLLLASNCKQSGISKNDTNKFSDGCYGAENDGNVITFRITRTDPLVQGTLIYNWAEKDRNSGSFEGKIENELILGTYTFLSEGLESKREVVFKISGDSLLEGTGPVEVLGDLTSFKSHDDLKFGNMIPLVKGECPN